MRSPIPAITLALVCLTAAFYAPPAHAQSVTRIYGTVYQVDGQTPAAGASITVTRATKTGTLHANSSRVYKTNSAGYVAFTVPRTTGTDTSVVHIKADFGNLQAGQLVYVPDADSAALSTLTTVTQPTFVVVAVPASADDSTQSIFDPAGTQKIPGTRVDVGTITGDTTGTTNQPAFGRFENMLGQFTSGTSDSTQQNAASVFVARNVAEGKADADPYEEFDFMEELAPHLADGSIAVVVASGAEKMRYVCGWASAVNNTGKQVYININSIYDLAKKELGGEATPAEY